MNAPNLAAGRTLSGWVRIWLGKPDEAIEHFAHAMRLSPLDPLRRKYKPELRTLISSRVIIPKRACGFTPLLSFRGFPLRSLACASWHSSPRARTNRVPHEAELSLHFLSFRETFFTGPYRFLTVVSHGVPPSRTVSILRYRLSYLLALRGIWSGLSQRVICQ
jgi:hypothetical protein